MTPFNCIDMTLLTCLKATEHNNGATKSKINSFQKMKLQKCPNNDFINSFNDHWVNKKYRKHFLQIFISR